MNNDIKENSSLHDYVSGKGEICLFDLFLILVKRKKMILYSCLVAFVLALCIVLLMPNIYSAKARISLRNQKEKSLYISMLKGNVVADAIIDKFGLMDLSSQESKSQIYQELQEQMTILAGKKNGIIQIIVENKDPKRAAEMANAYVEELVKISDKQYLSNPASELRQLIEKRLQVVKGELKQTERKLKALRQNTIAYRTDDQSKTIEPIAGLKGEWATKEVELGGTALKEQPPRDSALLDGFVPLENQSREPRLSPVADKLPADRAMLPASVDEMGLQYAMLVMDFRMQKTLLEFLSFKYEEAKVEEAKSTQVLQVLDAASVPDQYIRPKRSLIVLLATFCAGCIAVFVAIFQEYISSMPQIDLETW